MTAQLPFTQSRDDRAANQHPPGHRLLQANSGPPDRGFSRTGLAHEAKNLTSTDLECDVVNGPKRRLAEAASELDSQVLDRQHEAETPTMTAQLPFTQSRDDRAANQHPPGHRLLQANSGPPDRGFSRTGLAHEAKNLTSTDLECDV